MKIYFNSNGDLREVAERQFRLERDIQSLFERNLKSIMSLTLVKSEFTIKNRRIDTLAFDEQTRAFIIIEYKRDKNISVIDQGFTYLGLMLENKADFIVEYNERLHKNLKRGDVDWSQTRVVFVSTSFTENQLLATNFKDIAIELWEAKQYENGIVLINPLKKTQAAESIKPLAQKNEDFKRIADEIKVYTEDEHMARATEEIQELYGRFKEAILRLDGDIEIKPTKIYIAFKKDTNVVDIEVQKKALKVFINAKIGALEDARGLMRDVSNVGHFGNGDYQVQVDSDKDLEYIMSLVKQVL